MSAANWTVRQLMDALKKRGHPVSKSTVLRWRAGGWPESRAMAVAVAEILRMTPEQVDAWLKNTPKGTA